jgi:squalene-hopene/tetraprenyl-beta-curcumene cyclase
MNATRWARSVLFAGVGLLSAFLLTTERPVEAADTKTMDATIEKALAYLKKAQADDGSWSSAKSPGCTGIIVTGLLESGKVTPDDPMVAKALKYIESLVNEKGHIAGKDPKNQLLNYVTSVNVMALKAANKGGKYDQAIANAAKFLKSIQWTEGQGKEEKDDFYGGAGYDSKSRPDLSNQSFFLEALKASGVPQDDPAFKKAAVFVSRCQNLKSEFNDRPWAGKIDDGSFIYSAAGGGQTKVESADGALVGYGSMTYAGIKSLIYCGVSKDDPRIKKAYEWTCKHYTLDANPGFPSTPKEKSERGLYYYYQGMAKCLEAMGVNEVVDSAGNKHDWRTELVEAIAKRQKADGSWTNENDGWLEGDPNLVTGYVLLTLSHCKAKK